MSEQDIRLTPEQAARLHKARTDIADLQIVLDKAARAGLDVNTHRDRLAEVEQLRTGLLREFSPGRHSAVRPGTGQP